MSGNSAEERSSQRDAFSEEGPKSAITLLINKQLNASNAGLWYVHIIATGSHTEWSRELEVEANFLFVVFRVFAVSRRAIVHVARKGAGNTHRVGLVPQATRMRVLCDKRLRRECQ
jgi:hypothetical protein